MDISIIIVNRNTSNLLKQCLDSIHGSKPHLNFEIIVVDNGSVDDSISVCTQYFPEVQVISNNQNFGFAKANNQGLRVAKGRYVLLLNSDTILLPSALDELVRVADRHPEVGAVGPKLLHMDGTLQKSWSKFPTLWSEIIGRQVRQSNPIANEPFAFDVDWVGGACILVRSKTVEEIGLMDEDYFFYSEEVDWCFRMKKNGWKVWYLSTAEVYHLGGGSAKKTSLPQLSLLYQNKIRYFSKYYGTTQATLLRYGLAGVYFLGLIRRVLFFRLREKEEYLDRIQVQSKLIWCLLLNKYPEVQS